MLGKALGIVASYILMTIGLYGTLMAVSLVTADPGNIAKWLMLSSAVVTFGLGSAAAIIWHCVNTDMKEEEA